MELTAEELNKLENRFIEQINSIHRDGVDKNGLINYLYSVNFFTAPYTAQYGGSFKGGLLKHSIDTYDNLLTLVNNFNIDNIDVDSITILGLLHDIGKSDLYESYYANKKVYTPLGSKSDEMGRFNWVTVPSYKIKDSKDRFVLGSVEENSLYLIQNYVPLSIEETSAILNSKGNKDVNGNEYGFMNSFTKYPLSLYLYMADMKATFIDGYINE